MNYYMEDAIMLRPAGTTQKKLENRSRCRRWCPILFLVSICVVSCGMSIATAVLYFNIKKLQRSETKTSPMHAASLQGHLPDEQTPAYAHKVLSIDFKEMKKIKTLEDVTLHINPKHNHGAYEIARGVTLLDQGINITHSGTYFVYKSIYFTPVSRMKCVKSFTSSLKLNSTLRSEGVSTLLESVHTCCPTCQDSSETAFTGGVFYLEQGDIIQVEVAGHQLIDVEKDVTYVGLMKLGNLH